MPVLVARTTNWGSVMLIARVLTRQTGMHNFLDLRGRAVIHAVCYNCTCCVGGCLPYVSKSTLLFYYPDLNGICADDHANNEVRTMYDEHLA